MKFLLVFTVAVTALLFGRAALADGNTASVRGYVRDLSGQPVDGAIVTIANQADSAVVETDENGFFSVISILPGLSIITASKTGYMPLCPTAALLASNQTSDAGTVHIARGLTDRLCLPRSVNLVRPGVTADVYDIF